MTTNLAQLARAYLVFANDGALPSLKILKDENNNEVITAGIYSRVNTKNL